MAAFSISIAHGASGNKMSDFTIGTLALNAGDCEVRINNADSNGKVITDHEAIMMLRAIIRQIENGGSANTNLILRTGGTPPPPLV
jgi:Ribonuclease G/E